MRLTPLTALLLLACSTSTPTTSPGGSTSVGSSADALRQQRQLDANDVDRCRELAAQWGRWGVRVNAIAAGYFLSDMTKEMFASPKMAEWVRVRQPMPFTAVPDDFVGAVLLLASDAGRFITGQTYAVDGGWTAL